MLSQKVTKYEVNETNYKNFCFPDEFLLGIYEIVKFTKELCERENIEYFIDSGTLLGCVRDGGQIHYDTDADFGIDPVNFKKIISFKSEFESKNYQFNIKDCKAQVFNLNYRILTDYDDKIILCPALDILIYKPFKEKFFTKYVIQDEQLRKEYPYACHYQKHLYPLKDYTYRCLDAEPLILKGPNNPKNYLDGTYPDWQIKKIYDHKIYVIKD